MTQNTLLRLSMTRLDVRKVIGSSPISSTKDSHLRVAVFFVMTMMDSNPSKCGAGERRLLRLDAAEQLFSAKRKMQIESYIVQNTNINESPTGFP